MSPPTALTIGCMAFSRCHRVQRRRNACPSPRAEPEITERDSAANAFILEQLPPTSKLKHARPLSGKAYSRRYTVIYQMRATALWAPPGVTPSSTFRYLLTNTRKEHVCWTLPARCVSRPRAASLIGRKAAPGFLETKTTSCGTSTELSA